MSAVNGAALALIYLMAVDSWTAWDAIIAAIVAATGVLWIDRLVLPRLPGTRVGNLRLEPAAFARLGVAAVADFVAGAFRVLRLVASGTTNAGFIEVPTAAASEASRALSAFLLTLAPDSFVAHYDEDRRLFVIHVIDLARADAIREAHRRQYARDIARLFPSG